ncbi:hypothetical protein L1987_01002 [Smallanthus sonchifolius]|uniref:Uncharacterized protein n=1 Tax=Smallanthus sonchifolius TaxID=185202 RepID=A0ACB9K3V5_9ASTR|nr:hypothetical protein L1987_01002 [Smallanthus sonchifolius]
MVTWSRFVRTVKAIDTHNIASSSMWRLSAVVYYTKEETAIRCYYLLFQPHQWRNQTGTIIEIVLNPRGTFLDNEFPDGSRIHPRTERQTTKSFKLHVSSFLELISLAEGGSRMGTRQPPYTTTINRVALFKLT